MTDRDDTPGLDVRHSRLSRLGAAVSGLTEMSLAERLEAARVQLSVDMSTPGSVDILQVLVGTLRRQPGTIFIDPRGIGDRTRELEQLALSIDSQRPVVFERTHEPTVSVHIGASPNHTALRVIGDGHGVRLTRGDDLLEQARPPTGLGVVFAAAVAAGEIFKESAQVFENLRTDHQRLDFCPVSLDEDLERAPLDLPRGLDLTLIGLGAVGTATVLILSLFETSGRVVLIDDQDFAIENLGTYSIGTLADVAGSKAKVDLAADRLRAFECHPFNGTVSAAIREIDEGRLPWTAIAMSGLDSVESRDATQLLWPDVMIDSSTGDTAAGVRVSVDGDACLMCLIQEGRSDRSAVTDLLEATGLSHEDVVTGSDLITEDHVRRAKPEVRDAVRRALGTPVCGLGRAIGLAEGGQDDYRPSIPFVSQQAACLGVGRLIARLHGVQSSESFEPNLLQYDTMLGPTNVSALRLRPREGCYSVARRNIIEQVRDHRQHLNR